MMSHRLKIKVCGMRDPSNVAAISATGPDYLGFIFCDASPRFAGTHPSPAMFAAVHPSVVTVGVFVNDDISSVTTLCSRYGLRGVQLHGNETPRQCRELRNSGLITIKAFALHDDFDFKITDRYESSVDYFLFDTMGKLHGGTGEKYDWRILARYEGSTPFFISGGIGADDITDLKRVSHPKLYAVDINSRFEKAPAMKDVEAVRTFINEMNKLK